MQLVNVLAVTEDEARHLLQKHTNVEAAIEAHLAGPDALDDPLGLTDLNFLPADTDKQEESDMQRLVSPLFLVHVSHSCRAILESTLSRQSSTTISFSQPVAGFTNLGNTCYLNTLLQVYLRLPAFHNAIVSFTPLEVRDYIMLLFFKLTFI